MKLLVVLFALLAGPLFAQSQSEMNIQAQEDAAKADKVLNQVYKKVLASLDEDGVKLLKESQRAWIAFRDAEAKFAEDEARGGSMAPLLYFGAVHRLTEERIKQLKDHLGDDAPATPPVEEKPKPEPKSNASGAATAKTQHQAAQAFFNAYKAHDRKAAQKVASEAALIKLVWDPAAGDSSGLKLMDDSHIYYEGGSIQLKFEKTKDGRWIVSDVGMTAD